MCRGGQRLVGGVDVRRRGDEIIKGCGRVGGGGVEGRGSARLVGRGREVGHVVDVGFCVDVLVHVVIVVGIVGIVVVVLADGRIMVVHGECAVFVGDTHRKRGARVRALVIVGFV